MINIYIYIYWQGAKIWKTILGYFERLTLIPGVNWVNNCGQYMIATGHCRVFSLLFTFLTSICFHPTTTATTPRVPRSSPGEGVGGSKPVRFGQMGKRGGGLPHTLTCYDFFTFWSLVKGQVAECDTFRPYVTQQRRAHYSHLGP